MDGSTYIKTPGQPDPPHAFDQPRLPVVTPNAERTLPDQQMPKPKAVQAEVLYPYVGKA